MSPAKASQILMAKARKAMTFLSKTAVVISWSLLFVSWDAAQGGPVPGVVVAPDGKGFQTENGRSFVPFGVTYYRPGTGWGPQVGKQFDPAETAKHFKQMKSLGVNCVRVFLSYGSFMTEPGRISEEG